MPVHEDTIIDFISKNGDNVESFWFLLWYTVYFVDSE